MIGEGGKYRKSSGTFRQTTSIFSFDATCFVIFLFSLSAPPTKRFCCLPRFGQKFVSFLGPCSVPISTPIRGLPTPSRAPLVSDHRSTTLLIIILTPSNIYYPTNFSLSLSSNGVVFVAIPSTN